MHLLFHSARVPEVVQYAVLGMVLGRQFFPEVICTFFFLLGSYIFCSFLKRSLMNYKTLCTVNFDVQDSQLMETGIAWQ